MGFQCSVEDLLTKKDTKGPKQINVEARASMGCGPGLRVIEEN